MHINLKKLIRQQLFKLNSKGGQKIKFVGKLYKKHKKEKTKKMCI